LIILKETKNTYVLNDNPESSRKPYIHIYVDNTCRYAPLREAGANVIGFGTMSMPQDVAISREIYNSDHTPLSIRSGLALAQ
jgi:hypothetical protein